MSVFCAKKKYECVAGSSVAFCFIFTIAIRYFLFYIFWERISEWSDECNIKREKMMSAKSNECISKYVVIVSRTLLYVESTSSV